MRPILLFGSKLYFMGGDLLQNFCSGITPGRAEGSSIWFQGSNWYQQHVSQVPYLLNYYSNPKIKLGYGSGQSMHMKLGFDPRYNKYKQTQKKGIKKT